MKSYTDIEQLKELTIKQEEPNWIKELEAMPAEKVQAAMDKIRVEHPIFEVGDIIKHKEEKDSYKILAIEDDCYKLENNIVVSFNAQDSWEIVEKPVSKFDSCVIEALRTEYEKGRFDMRNELEALVNTDASSIINEKYPNASLDEKLRLYDIAIKGLLSGFKKGKDFYMKNAIECLIEEDGDILFADYSNFDEDKYIRGKNLKAGDKVKLIIVKEK